MRHSPRSPLTKRFWLVLIVLVLPLSGCFFSREMAQTRRDIERAYPDLRLQKQVVLNLGPLSLRMAEWLTRLVPEEETASAARYLSAVSRVKVGIYHVEQGGSLDDFDVRRLGFEKSWKVALRTRDDESRVWMLYRDDGETVSDLYFVVLDEEDLVVARVRGRLSNLLTMLMQDHVWSRQQESASVPRSPGEQLDVAHELASE